MKLTAMVKLQPTDEQRQWLFDTLKTTNAACNDISQAAFDEQVFSQYGIHELVYYDIRERFELTAQVVSRCISKVADAYKTAGKKAQCHFRKLGSITYDSRILNWRLSSDDVSIWLLGGRQIISFTTGAHQRHLLQYQKGETDLVYRKGELYLFTTCEVPEDDPFDPDGFLGVDLGIANIAADSDGEQFSGSQVKNVRHRQRRLRQKLQAKHTKGAYRRLKKLAGKEARFAQHTNHVISKRIVKKAKGTRQGIALEDLSDIRTRITVKKSQRNTLHSWSFYQLRQFIEYKAQLKGVPVKLVHPAYTSQQCSQCGCIDKRNRPTQATFLCTQCGHAAQADVNAASNIAGRAVASKPASYSDTPSGVAPG